MANFTKTITNRFNLFGIAPSDKWAAYKWGAFKWGEGTADLATRTIKVLSNSIVLDDINTALSVKIISETLFVDSAPAQETLSDGSGYEYIFPGDVTNAEDRVSTSWNAQTTTSSWTTGTGTSTVWT